MPNPPLSSDQLCDIILCDGWRLTFDAQQWIVEHKQGSKWRRRYFVATQKRVLEAIFREAHITLTPQARRAVDGLPDRFGDTPLSAPKIPQSPDIPMADKTAG